LPGVKSASIYPLLFNIFLFAGLLILCFYYISNLDIPNFVWDFWGGFGAGLAEMVNFLLESFKWIILIPAAFAVAYFSFSIVGVALASPLNDILSKRIEQGLCEQESESISLKENVQSTVLSVMDSVKLVLKQTFYTLLTLPFMLIPIAGFIPFFLVSSWFTGLSYLDVGLARHHFRAAHKKILFKKFKWRVFGMGMSMALLFMIPFLQLLLMPLGVASGTYLYCSIDWKTFFKEENLEAPLGHVPPKIINPI